jgi:hypothetical protein
MPQRYGITGAQRYATAPAIAPAGSTYFNTTDGKHYISNGNGWYATLSNDDLVMNANPFGGRHLYQSALNDAMFKARERWTVTAKIYDRNGGTLLGTLSNAQVDQFFDGDYEGGFTIAANNYVVLNVNFNGFFYGFPYGWFIVSHYYVSWTESVSVRVYCNYAPHGLGWHTLNTVDEVRRSPDQLIQKAYNSFYQLSEVEFTLTAPPGAAAQVGEIEWALDRPMTGNEMPTVDKYQANILYTDLSWKNAGTEVARITQAGAATFTQLAASGATINGTVLTASGDRYLAPVACATTANITLSGTSTIDGYAFSATERILVKNQTNAFDNGIYVAAAGAWSRATDANTAAKVTQGAKVKVLAGTTSYMKIFTQTDPVATLGTDSQTWRCQTHVDTGGLFSFPTPRGAGQLYYNQNQRALAIWDGLKWVYSAANVWTVTSSTRPTFVQDGLIIYETDTGLSYIWVGGTTNAWVAFSGGSGGSTPDPFSKTEIRTTKLDYNPAGMGDITVGVSFNMNGQKIYGMADPVNPDHATTKNYVDNKVAEVDYRPLGIMGMGQITANTANTANSTTPVDIAGLTTTITCVAGRWYKLNVWANFITTVAGDRIQLILRDGATSLVSSISQAPATTAFNMTATYIGQFTAGSHVLKVSVARASGTGVITMQGSATSPGQFVVEDIGT